MKNNYTKYFFVIVFIILSTHFSKTFANTLNFTAKNINTINDEIIKASENIEIITDEGIKIKADNLEFNIKKKFYIIENNVSIKDNSKNLIIQANKIFYDENSKIYKSVGFTKINQESKIFLKSSDIVFDKASNLISSNYSTSINDLNSTKLELANFTLSINENVLKSSFATLIDKEKNKYEINNFRYHFDKESFLGNDISINKDNTLIEKNKEFIPRMKGRAIVSDKKNYY